MVHNVYTLLLTIELTNYETATKIVTFTKQARTNIEPNRRRRVAVTCSFLNSIRLDRCLVDKHKHIAVLALRYTAQQNENRQDSTVLPIVDVRLHLTLRCPTWGEASPKWRKNLIPEAGSNILIFGNFSHCWSKHFMFLRYFANLGGLHFYSRDLVFCRWVLE